MSDTLLAGATSDKGPDPDEPVEPTAERTGRLARLRSNPWARFVARRFLNLVLVLLGLLICDFLILRLIPGNPAEILAGVTGADNQVKLIQRELGLNQSLGTQAYHYVVNLLHGNLGHSFTTNQAVTQIIDQRIGTSAALAGLSLALVLLISIPLGVFAGAVTRDRRHRQLETGFTAVTSVVGSLPQYFAATLLAYIFGLELRLLPVAGGTGLKSLILPALAVALPPTAIVARVVRVETLNVLAQEYIRTARSKRLRARTLYFRHVLPNVMTAALTIGGIVFAQLIGGAVVVENVFDLNGLGTTLIQGVLNRDYPVIQGVVLVLGVIIVVVNAVIDIILAIIDPRTKTRSA